MAIAEELRKPFHSDQIHWRVGSTTKDKQKGMALAYIDARDVMDRLDTVCGPSGWQSRYRDAGNGKTYCEIGIKFDDEWVWKGDGAGDTGFEGDKGAFSDAFKRAGVRWGIGRYLYGLGNTWVALKDGKYIQNGEYAKLNKAHNDHAKGNMGGESAFPGQSMTNVQLRAEVETIEKEIDEIDGMIDWSEWGASNKDRIERLPAECIAQIRTKFKQKGEDLKASVANAEMDDEFAATVAAQ
jgi:hypothetical protein